MQEVKVYCVNWGTKYSPDHVHILKDAVSKYLTLPHSFFVYTDQPDLYENSIQTKYDLEGWWNKLLIFENTGPCLYFDLDLIIHGNIDHLVRDEWHMINGFWKKGKKYLIDRPDLGTSYANSSIMSWTDSRHILNHFMKDPEKYIFQYNGDDRYLHHEHDYKTYEAKDKIYSYKTDRFKYQPDKSVALFHGEPKITDCLDHEVVRRHWNVGTTKEN
jgi:hypothetical protein